MFTSINVNKNQRFSASWRVEDPQTTLDPSVRTTVPIVFADGANPRRTRRPVTECPTQSSAAELQGAGVGGVRVAKPYSDPAPFSV